MKEILNITFEVIIFILASMVIGALIPVIVSLATAYSGGWTFKQCIFSFPFWLSFAFLTIIGAIVLGLEKEERNKQLK